MTIPVTIPKIGAAEAWRDAARRYLCAGVPPEDMNWGGETTARGLFDEETILPSGGQITVPKRFVELSSTVVWHSAPDRFARLYALLWRLRCEPGLLGNRADPAVSKLMQMEKNVRRCQHKMKAFVRFREISAPNENRRSFAAWFEPTHHTVEPTAQFFRKRFADMDWQILTPDVCAFHEDGKVRFEDGRPKPDLPEDASEELWITYFRNIFNPARLKVSAMTSEMPRKYWKNLPEAASIPGMIASAPARAREMALAAPTLPSPQTDAVQVQLKAHQSAWQGSGDVLNKAIGTCTRCPLHCAATQAVCGEGPRDARLMIVGEQPGDAEDLAGRPFVGPAGQLLDRIASEVGLDLSAAYMTSAVKHFKYRASGRRRIHQSPNTSEIETCKWWLAAERDMLHPDLILALGATAARALTGNGGQITARRGEIEQGMGGTPVLITFHPASLLRNPDATNRAAQTDAFKADVTLAARLTA